MSSSTAGPNLKFSMFFFFNDTATTEIYTLSLHDALPIFLVESPLSRLQPACGCLRYTPKLRRTRDRKSTRLNSSHSQISYAVFCLKKKTKKCNSNQVRNHLRYTYDELNDAARISSPST